MRDVKKYREIRVLKIGNRQVTQNYETDRVKFPFVGKINKSVTLSGQTGREAEREGEREGR